MGQVTLKFLDLVQRAGWHIAKVSKDHVVARCPSADCCMAAKLDPDHAIPQIARRDEKTDISVNDPDELRKAFRARRHDLELSIRDVEHFLGLTADHLAKMEKDNPSKDPSVFLMFCWADGLGMEIVLRPKPMPKIVLGTIESTRGKNKRGSRPISQDPRRRHAKLG